MGQIFLPIQKIASIKENPGISRELMINGILEITENLLL